jgi:hypothetical protein
VKVRLARLVRCDELGVNDGRKWQRKDRVTYCGKVFGKILAVAAVDGCSLAVVVKLGAPTIELEFMQPAVAARRDSLEDRR